MATANTFEAKAAPTIRDDMLRTYRNGMIQLTGVDPLVIPRSDPYIRFSAVAQEISVVHANTQIKADQLMGDTATGEDQDRLYEQFGLTRQGETSSVGNIVLDASAATLVAVDTELVDGAGLRYAVTVGGLYSDGDSIPIQAIDTGEDTNHAEGDILRWVGTAPAFANSDAAVDVGGLTEGADIEDDETFRQRFYDLFTDPPAGDNPAQVAIIAEESDPRVQKAFPYPALQGPGTVHVAVCAAPTATSKSRELDATVLSGTVRPYVVGKIGEHADTTVTGVEDYAVNAAVYLTIPNAPTASQPGSGGGWLDGTPWPAAGSATAYAEVTVVTSTTQITVDASAAPTAGVSRIAWLSHLDWTIKTATVVSYTGTGPYALTLDSPLAGIVTGVYVFPQCTNQDLYAEALLDAFALMGPGEKTADAPTLVRAYRHPPPQQSWPYSLNATVLRKISDVGDEVLDVSWAYRSATIAPVAGAVTDAPNILTPAFLAFYPSV
jgi:uncharacterized phage protein gp47/JayE